MRTKKMVPPGGFVPCHSHPDAEDFIIISGEGLGIREKSEGGFEWIETKTGDYIHLPGGTPHAWRNVSSEPLVSLVFMTKNLAQFVQDTGRPLTGKPATPEYFEYFEAIAKKYGHWLATPEENAALGLPPYH